ncbi:MAG: AMP-binding protein [Propionibacteriaceae bacterium]|nr:AMP-binding protein [Propionibacteriaceae bacterium]
MSSRVEVVTPDQVEQALAAMLTGAGTVVRVVDQGVRPTPVDESDLPEGFTGALVSTSGSTGRAKTVMLSHEALIAGAEATHRRLGGGGAWINPLPVTHVAGLMTVVRAVLAGRPYVPVSARLAHLPVPPGRSYLSLVPAQLHRCLRDPVARERLASYHTVLIGGAVVDSGLRTAGEAAGITLVATYGMSETCGGAVYDGLPLDGVTIGFSYDGARADASPAGRILLTTPAAFSGYLGDPTQTAATLHDHCVLTSDRGELVDGRLRVLGRIDDVVQSGGANVDLAEVQGLLDQEFHGQVACFAAPDPVWGATVVVASTNPTLEQIKARLDARLESAARPRGCLRVEAIPHTASGKLDRPALVERWEHHERVL